MKDIVLGVDSSTEEAQRRFRADPFEWLPRPVAMHGVHEFVIEPRLLGSRHEVRCEIGGPWVRTDTVSRLVRLDVTEGVLRWLLSAAEGELSVEQRAHARTVLALRVLVATPDGLAAPLTRRLLRALLADTARRLSRRRPASSAAGSVARH